MNANGGWRSDLSSLSASQAEELDRACDRFEAEWRAGKRPKIEDHLEGIAAPLRSALLEDLIAVERHWRQRCGDRTLPDECHDRFPSSGAGVESAPTVADAWRNAYRPSLSRRATIEADSLGPEARHDPEPAALAAEAISDVKLSADLQARAVASDGPPLASTGSGPVIPGYTIEGELGRGGMGVVYRAKHLRLNRVVAIKVIDVRSFPTELGVRRFLAEAELVATLDHSGIVPVYEVGEYGGWPFFAMRLVDGGSLAQHLSRLLKDQRAAVRLLVQVARAVHYAHQHGVLHRDLKPANILLDSQGAPVVADFGLAKRLDGSGSLSCTGTALGTPAYVAPEQVADSKHTTTAADVYSLGAILFELLTGRPPFRAGGIFEVLRKLHEERPPPLRALDPSIDPTLELICLKCLEKNPQHRYSSAEALAADLDRWLVGDTVSVRPPSLTALLRVWARQNFGSAGWTVAGGAACGLVMGGYNLLELLGTKLHRLGAAYESLTGLRRPWLAAGPIPDPVLTMAEGVMYLLLLALMLATSALVRARTRGADIAAGLITGLVTAVTFFTVSFGWWSVYSWAVVPASADLTLLAGSDDLLLSRYPDLATVPEAKRRPVLLDKAQFDQAIRIPQGILLGMVLAVGLTVPVSVALVCFAGALLRRYGRLRMVVPLYLERAVPGVIFCGYLFLLVQRALLYRTPPQHPVCYLLLLAWCGLAVAAASRRWPWAIRLALQVAWFGHYAVTNYWVWYEF
jgi:eukaryotic-like serine/threonine-protein kinase